MRNLGTILAITAAATWTIGAELPQVPAPLEQPPVMPGLQIYSKGRSVLSINDNTVYFTNEVMVVYPAAKTNEAPAILRCRELTGKRLPTGEIDDIIAEGDVSVDRGLEKARGQKAVYNGITSRILLTGGYGAFTQPMLVSSNGVTNLADLIIYDRVENKLFSEGNTKIFVPTNALRQGTSSGAIDKASPLPGL